ncbi:MAG: hypothetical protein ACKVOL_13100 [Novosphingobium sp.]
MPDTTYVAIGNNQKQLIDIGTDTYAEVMSLPRIAPISWVPTTVFDAKLYPDVEIQIINTPTTAYVFQDSFDGINFNDCLIWDKVYSSIASAAVAGRFRLPGTCYLRARQGAGSTLLIRAGS